MDGSLADSSSCESCGVTRDATGWVQMIHSLDNGYGRMIQIEILFLGAIGVYSARCLKRSVQDTLCGPLPPSR